MATNNIITSCSNSSSYNNLFSSLSHSKRINHSSCSNTNCILPPLGKSSTYNNINHSFQLFMRSNLKYGAIVVKAASEPGVPLPPPNKSPFPGWQWLIGILLSVVIPALRTKGGPLSLLKSNLDKALHTVEEVVEVVEEMAEKVDEVAEEIEKKLPGDSKLKKSLDSIEHLAEQAITYAKQAEGVINKVEEIEKQVEDQLLEAKNSSGQDNSLE